MKNCKTVRIYISFRYYTGKLGLNINRLSSAATGGGGVGDLSEDSHW
jgi:hypothetical protein